jgi:hypothetical protein
MHWHAIVVPTDSSTLLVQFPTRHVLPLHVVLNAVPALSAFVI